MQSLRERPSWSVRWKCDHRERKFLRRKTPWMRTAMLWGTFAPRVTIAPRAPFRRPPVPRERSPARLETPTPVRVSSACRALSAPTPARQIARSPVRLASTVLQARHEVSSIAACTFSIRGFLSPAAFYRRSLKVFMVGETTSFSDTDRSVMLECTEPSSRIYSVIRNETGNRSPHADVSNELGLLHGTTTRYRIQELMCSLVHVSVGT